MNSFTKPHTCPSRTSRHSNQGLCKSATILHVGSTKPQHYVYAMAGDIVPITIVFHKFFRSSGTICYLYSGHIINTGRCGQLGLARGQIRPSRQTFGRQKTKMQIDFSPLTVYNSVTNYTPLTMKKRNLKSGTEKKIGFRGQFATRGHNSPSLTIWTLDSNTKRSTK